MSTLSSSLNALASSTIFDLWERLGRRPLDAAASLRLSRWATVGWGVVLMGFAMLFRSLTNPVVELGLGVASFTYGGLLGAFVLGLWSRRARQREAVIAYVVTLFALALLVTSGTLAWPLYTALGAAITLGVGTAVAHRNTS
jgi:Na+/proline symporter